jgi:hypothetical protein
MPRGRRPGSHQQIKCAICLHPERGRIDFLVCSGAGVQPTAKKFGVSYDSLRNHVAKHISQSYRDAVCCSWLKWLFRLYGKATTRSVGRAKLVRMKPKQIQRLDGLFGYDSDTHVRADAR